MRVPVYVVLLLVFAEAGGLWWQGTRRYDFVSPPSEERLAQVSAEAARDFSPPAPSEQDTKAAAAAASTEAPAETAPEPEFDPGDTDTAPGLDAYAADSQKGADYLVKLATALERKGAFPRALLAWERVLDFGRAEPTVYNAALAAVQRLRPTLPPWNIDPEATIPVVIHAGAASDTAAALKPVLETVTRDLGFFSGGVLAFTSDLTVGKKTAAGPGPAPVALWLSGAAKDAPGTPAISFAVERPEELRELVLANVYTLVAGQLKRKTAYAPLPDRPLDEEASRALNFRVTRLCWRELGVGLNLPPPPPPAAAPSSGHDTPKKPAPVAPGKPAAPKPPRR